MLELRSEVLQVVPYHFQEHATQCPINHPVVIRQRKHGHMTDANGVTAIRLNHHHPFGYASHGQYGHLGLVDNGVPVKVSNIPRLVMVNVPPWISSG